jgi:hypothetical protein
MTPNELEMNLSRNEAVQAVRDLARCFWQLEEESERFRSLMEHYKQQYERLECAHAILFAEHEKLQKQAARHITVTKCHDLVKLNGSMIVSYKGVTGISTVGNPGGDHDQIVDESFRNTVYTIYGLEELTIEF